MKARQANKILTNIIRNRKNISYYKQYIKYINKSCLYNTALSNSEISLTFMPYQIYNAEMVISKKYRKYKGNGYNKYYQILSFFRFGIKLDSTKVEHELLCTIAPMK